MDFGVQEVLTGTSKASAPGWAYVPVIANSSKAPAPRKRARFDIPSSTQQTTAKQDAKILRELALLDRENHRDVNIPVPIRHRDNAGRVTHGKVTPAVRKILLSQKTFANHLSDYEALGAPTVPNPPAARATATASPSAAKRSHKKKDPNAPTPLRQVASAQAIKAEDDTPMTNAAGSILKDVPDAPPHPRDNDVLLVSRIPQLPSQEEMARLLAAPPLGYAEARGSWIEEDRRKPARTFCEVCGYWGRVKCTRCGERVCALECMAVHQQECFTRYGA